jgi:hypothetical protein
MAGAAGFAREFMAQFLSGAFRRQRYWADNYVMTHCAALWPQLVQDMARGCSATTHTNSNGHTTSGQILPQTLWGGFLEHDKGRHWRQGLVAPPNATDSEAAPGARR